MSKRKFFMYLLMVCLILVIIWAFYLYSEQLAEQRLQDCIKRLKESGFIVEERSLSSFNVNSEFKWHYFSDFRKYALQENVKIIYFDRNMHALYFLLNSTKGIEAEIFYYK
ncbi:hypothetical protein DRO54_07670 [Candidatus Bathyarchaeota archaeon]|nr:MAG: hypothetical protein DRO54_07670 [Candidatus Bathyarchaeota archaeon]